MMQQDGTSLSKRDIGALQKLLKQCGERSLVARIGVSRQTLGRVMAGLPCRRGSVHLVLAALARADVATGDAPRADAVGTATPHGDGEGE